ncbi:UNVERIFIED_CONTAM: hypothetical protein GTU68_002749 [Idotea baltica]|nr:hypothetical protein [Idotea baltica]
MRTLTVRDTIPKTPASLYRPRTPTNATSSTKSASTTMPPLSPPTMSSGDCGEIATTIWTISTRTAKSMAMGETATTAGEG